MSWCETCNKGVDYCDCVPQKYRERIAKEIEAIEPAPKMLNKALFKMYQDLFVRVARGQK